jgi:predicted lipoprotein with Yx(FWY)xxD motif
MQAQRTHHRGPQRRFVTLVGLATLAVAAGSITLAAVPALAARAPQRTSPTTIVVEKTVWGAILALSTGWTVYRFVPDGNNKSTCFRKCAVAWPPVLLVAGQKEPLGKGVTHLGSFNRGGGERQVSYEGIPLYLFIGDKKPGEVNGNVKDNFGQWWTVNPAHPKAVPVKSGHGGTTVPPTGVAY